MTRRPNILFVMADQMAPGFLPIHGHKLVYLDSASSSQKSSHQTDNLAQKAAQT